MRLTPARVLVAGFCVLVGGFLYDVIFAGIPYQDPTPELSAAYDRHARIAALLRWGGLGLLAAGGVWAVLRRSGPGR